MMKYVYVVYDIQSKSGFDIVVYLRIFSLFHFLSHSLSTVSLCQVLEFLAPPLSQTELFSLLSVIHYLYIHVIFSTIMTITQNVLFVDSIPSFFFLPFLISLASPFSGLFFAFVLYIYIFQNI